mmetsp:Transcript_30204/g.72819  ORF Transcript_30204/g.72819 Transcript_30204/m.72819 type:complete len:126 (+) Transcript_30204:8-385(+)
MVRQNKSWRDTSGAHSQQGTTCRVQSREAAINGNRWPAWWVRRRKRQSWQAALVCTAREALACWVESSASWREVPLWGVEREAALVCMAAQGASFMWQRERGERTECSAGSAALVCLAEQGDSLA